MVPSVDPRSIARQGLEHSVGGFLRTGSAIREAERAVQDVVSLGEAGSAGAARVGKAMADTLAGSSSARLGVLRATLSAIEAGATSSVGYLSKMGYGLLEALDAAKPEARARADAVRATLDAIAQEASDRGWREADYARFASELGHVARNPVYVMNMLDRVNVPSVGDVTRPAWYAVVASGFALEAQSEARADDNGERLHRILQLADPRIEGLARQQNDTRTLQHLERESRYAALPGLSDEGRKALHLASLRVVGDEVPYAPETALVLAHQARGQGECWTDRARRRADTHLLIDAAFAEARQGAFSSGTPAAAWMRLHDHLGAVGLSAEDTALLESAAFSAIVENKPASHQAIRWDLASVFERLSQADPGPQARGLLEAMERLTASVAVPESDGGDARVARLGMDLAEMAKGKRPDVGQAVMEAALDWIAARPSGRVDRKAILDIAKSCGGSGAAREALERITRLDTDPMQRAILETGQGSDAGSGGSGAAHPGIQEDDGFVMIGSVRVPKRALEK